MRGTYYYSIDYILLTLSEVHKAWRCLSLFTSLFGGFRSSSSGLSISLCSLYGSHLCSVDTFSTMCPRPFFNVSTAENIAQHISTATEGDSCKRFRTAFYHSFCISFYHWHSGPRGRFCTLFQHRYGGSPESFLLQFLIPLLTSV